MILDQIFYSSCWISSICIIWFYTDWFIYYANLFNLFNSVQTKYLEYITNNPDSYFPNFLYLHTINHSNSWIRFFGKLLNCPLCLIFWFSFVAGLYLGNVLIIGPCYIISLIIVLKIKNLFYNN